MAGLVEEHQAPAQAVLMLVQEEKARGFIVMCPMNRRLDGGETAVRSGGLSMARERFGGLFGELAQELSRSTTAIKHI